MCMPKSLVLANCRMNDRKLEYRRLYQAPEKLRRTAYELCLAAGIEPNRPHTLDDIPAFEKQLNVEIVVWGGSVRKPSILRKGSRPQESKIHLFYTPGHYMPILSICGFLSRNHFCHVCYRGYHLSHEHSKCRDICFYCRKPGRCISTRHTFCNACAITFPSFDCYRNHRETGVCLTRIRCPTCSSILDTNGKVEQHRCGQHKCSFCRKWVGFDHLCYMQPAKVKVTKTREDQRGQDDEFPFLDMARERDEVEGRDTLHKMIFYDFETKTNKSNEHVVILGVAHRVCVHCQDDDVTPTSECEYCGKNEHVFYDLNSFCEFIISEGNFGSTIIAHNQRAFDLILLSGELLKYGIVPQIINDGAKILCLTIEEANIRFIDSLSFISTKLSQFDKCFQLKTRKGYFPFEFLNSLDDHESYVGPYPDPEFFSPGQMTVRDREEFFAWYTENCKTTFHLMNDLLFYCRQDVNVLRLGCQAFRSNYIKHSRVDPFTKITLASAVNLTFRTNFLTPNTIGIIPGDNYQKLGRQSLEGRKFLKQIAEKEGLTIIPEMRIGQYFADGYCPSNNTIYEYCGDVVHGRPSDTRRPEDKHPIFKQMTNAEVYERLMMKLKFYKSLGYTVHLQWASEFEPDNNLNLECRPPLQPRASLYGGRTSVFKTYREAPPGSRILYSDFTSLYPYTMKNREYPVGHPEIITSNFKDITNYFGLALVKVLPPRGLYVPTLPYHYDGKLFFPLCRTCTENQQQTTCKHSDDERFFEGTYTTPELHQAVSDGYRIITIYEVWHYERRSDVMFKDFISSFQKLKQQASGWPSESMTEAEKTDYIENYRTQENVILERDKIEKNPALRTVFKLALNSSWGYFALSERAVSEYICEPDKFFRLLTNPRYEIHSADIVNEEILLLRYTDKEKNLTPNANCNVILASFVTTYGRLHLLQTLRQLDPDQLLYCDTDSVIYQSNAGQPILKLGSNFGQLTDELLDYGEGSYITEYIATAPKSYSLKIKRGQDGEIITQTKIKGFSLSYDNAQILNHETLKRMVCEGATDPIVTVNPNKMKRNLVSGKITSVTEKKKFTFTNDKRVGCANWNTLPFGY